MIVQICQAMSFMPNNKRTSSYRLVDSEFGEAYGKNISFAGIVCTVDCVVGNLQYF